MSHRSLHDFDNNTMLDGLEIYKALTHLLPYDTLDVPPPEGTGQRDDHTPQQALADRKAAEVKYYTGEQRSLRHLPRVG